MPHFPLPRPTIPILGQDPARIEGMTIIVVVTCQQCASGEQLGLLNAQPATCPSCGATVSLDRVSWDKQSPVPKIALSATKPLAKALQ